MVPHVGVVGVLRVRVKFCVLGGQRNIGNKYKVECFNVRPVAFYNWCTLLSSPRAVHAIRRESDRKAID